DLTIEEVDEVPLVGIADVPAIGGSYEMARTLFAMKSPLILAVQSQKTESVEVTAESHIGGIPVSLNIFDNEDYVKASVKAMGLLMKSFGTDAKQEEIPDEVLGEVRTQLSSQFKAQ